MLVCLSSVLDRGSTVQYIKWKMSKLTVFYEDREGGGEIKFLVKTKNMHK